MKTPSRLLPLVADGLVDGVIRQLMSGKEAMVYVVQCGDEVRCAKVYKEANKRGFHTAVDYIEGRKVKNSRQARAMAKGSRYGRQEQEPPGNTPRWTPCAAWPRPGCGCPRPTSFTRVCC
jgi:RIO kinase 1